MVASHGYTLLGNRPSNPRPIRWIVLFFVFGAGFHWHWLPSKLEPLAHHDDAYYTSQCSTVGGEGVHTKHLGGTPGYEVFENVWYRDAVFHMFTRQQDALPNEDEIMTPRTTLMVELDSPEAFTPDVCFKGTTIFLNEGAGSEWNGMNSYYGFMIENVLGAYVGLSNAMPGRPVEVQNAVVPWNRDWRNTEINGQLATAMWGKNVVEPEQWERLVRTGHEWVYFEKIIIVDRWAAHRKSPDTNVWNKMAASVYTAPHAKDFWAAARKKVLKYFDVTPSKLRRKHHIVYLDRQDTNRRVSNREHDAIVHTLGAIATKSGATFSHLVLANMTMVETVQAVSHATIMVSVHGSAMINMLWMPENSAVIELFPMDTFMREFEMPASALGFRYTALRNRDVITKEKWEADPGPKNTGKAHDGTAVVISVPLLADTVRAALKDEV